MKKHPLLSRARQWQAHWGQGSCESCVTESFSAPAETAFLPSFLPDLGFLFLPLPPPSQWKMQKGGENGIKDQDLIFFSAKWSFGELSEIERETFSRSGGGYGKNVKEDSVYAVHKCIFISSRMGHLEKTNPACSLPSIQISISSSPTLTRPCQ